MTELLGDECTSQDNDTLIFQLYKRKNRDLIIGKCLTALLVIGVFLLSLFSIDYEPNSNVSYSLSRICFISGFDWQIIIGYILYAAIICNVTIKIFDFIFYFKNRINRKCYLLLNLSFCFIGLVCSSLLELITTSDLHIFGFFSFACFLACMIINSALLLTAISLSENDKAPLHKKWWFIVGFEIFIVSLALYFSLLYLALVIIPFGNIAVLKITNFIFGVISPFICIYFFAKLLKLKNKTKLIILAIEAILLISIFVLSCLNIKAFQYVIDVLTYVSIAVFPTLGFCFLLNK